MLVQGDRVKDSTRDSKKEEKEGATTTTGSATMLESFLTNRIIQGMMTTTTTISKVMAIKRTTSSTTKERGIFPLLEMEMVNFPKGQEIPDMMKVMLLKKQNEFYLFSTLSTASPPDTLDHWLIDSGASRHFTGYKEALSNLVEKKTNLEIILGDNATYPVKAIGIVTLHFTYC